MERIDISLEMLVGWSTWAIMLWVDVADTDTDGVPVALPELGTEPTKVEDYVTITELGARAGTIAIALFALLAMNACATARPPAEAPETVGALSASYHSIAVAPVHATTDLAPAFGAVDSDQDAPVMVAAPSEKVEAPEIAPKTDGVTTGTVR